MYISMYFAGSTDIHGYVHVEIYIYSYIYICMYVYIITCTLKASLVVTGLLSLANLHTYTFVCIYPLSIYM